MRCTRFGGIGQRDFANCIGIYLFPTGSSFSFHQDDYGIVNPAFRSEVIESGADILDDYTEGTDVFLILRVMAGLCDGQNRDHQVSEKSHHASVKKEDKNM